MPNPGGEFVSAERPSAALAELYEISQRSNKISAFWFREVAVALGKNQPLLMAEPTESSVRRIAFPLRDWPDALVGVAAVYESFELWCNCTGECHIEVMDTPADWLLYARYVEYRHLLAYAVYSAPANMPPDHPLAAGKAYSFGSRLEGKLEPLSALVAALTKYTQGPYQWVK